MDNQPTELSTNSVFNLPENYTESNYLESGKRLAKAGQFLNWQIGRWYNSLEWGDKRDICAQVGINYASAKDCGSIEKKVKISMRNDNLTFQHHKVIAIAELDDKQRTELLQQAEDKNMSSKQLTTARDILLGRDIVKPAIPDTHKTNTSLAQDGDSPAHGEHNALVDEVRNDLPDVDAQRQSYNATFEADKELANLKQVNVDLVLKYDNEHRRAIRLEGDIRGLKSQIEKLEETIAGDGNIIIKLNDTIATLRGKLKPAPKTSVYAGLESHGYDGNAKEFKAKLVSILGGDNNVITAGRKKAYAALNITPKANGQLKSDQDRLTVYEWLVSNA